MSSYRGESSIIIASETKENPYQHYIVIQQIMEGANDLFLPHEEKWKSNEKQFVKVQKERTSLTFHNF